MNSRGIRAWLACAALTVCSSTLFAQKAPVEASSTTLPIQSSQGLLPRYFQELRARHLYAVAEQACQYRLEHSRLGRVERADLTIELADTLVEHAAFVSESQQTEMWGRAAQVLSELLEKDPENARRILLEAHLALIPAAEGHWRRWQVELSPWDRELSERARKSIDVALPKLLEIEKRIAAQLKSPRAEPSPDEPRGFELRALLARVTFHRARAEVDLALLPDTDGPDRSAALVRAEKLLKSLAETNEGEDLQWNSRVLLVQCQRLLGDLTRASRSLSAYQAQQPPPNVADRLMAESVRMMLAEDKVAEARKQLDAAIKSLSFPSGELGLLKAQQLADELRALTIEKSPRAQAVQELLTAHVEAMQRDVGGYWTFRAGLVEQQIRDELDYGFDVAPLVRRAESEFRAGKIPECLATYALAIAAAEKGGRAELVFDLSYTRASVAVQASQWTLAAETLKKALEGTQSPKAADAHLLYAYVLGKLFEEKPTQSRREQYTAALETHRKQYAAHPTFVDATWMLAELEERRLQITSALKLYGEIPADHARGPEARLRQARCYPQILDRLREKKLPLEAWETEAVTRLREMLPKETKRALTQMESEAAVILAQILLERRPADFETAEQLLERIFMSLEVLPELPADSPEKAVRQHVKASAMRLRVVSLAGQGRPQAATKLFDELSALEPLELLRILESLAPVAARSGEAVQDDLAKLQLQAARKLSDQRSRLQPADQRRLDLCLAQALVVSKRYKEAVDLYAELLKASPKDLALKKNYGELLLQCGTVEHARLALTTWRALEAQYKPASPDWFACRLNGCQSLYQAREYPQCLQQIQLTRLLHPTLGGPESAKKYEALEEKCRKAK